VFSSQVKLWHIGALQLFSFRATATNADVVEAILILLPLNEAFCFLLRNRLSSEHPNFFSAFFCRVSCHFLLLEKAAKHLGGNWCTPLPAVAIQARNHHGNDCCQTAPTEHHFVQYKPIAPSKSRRFFLSTSLNPCSRRSSTDNHAISTVSSTPRSGVPCAPTEVLGECWSCTQSQRLATPS